MKFCVFTTIFFHYWVIVAFWQIGKERTVKRDAATTCMCTCHDIHLLVEIVACAKLKQSKLFEHSGIYGIEWLIAKLKWSNELEHEDLRNDLQDIIHTCTYIHTYLYPSFTNFKGTPMEGVQYVLLNVGEECITRFMAQDHNPSAINHVKHDHTNIKWFIVAPWPTYTVELCADFRRWLLNVSADIARSIWCIQHALDYAIYGRGSAFNVAHEVTINVYNVLASS